MAIDMYRTALKLDPNCETSYKNMAYALEKSDHRKEAVRLLQEFLKRFPNSSNVNEVQALLKNLAVQDASAKG